jgi:hypothetical protein
MRIGVDTRELMGRPTGVGRYLAELLGAWADPGAGVAGRHEFVCYGPEAMPGAVAARIAPLGVKARVVPGRGGAWWEQAALPRAAARDRLDLFFAPAYTAPLSCGCPVVLTIHDLSYFARPEWFTWREGLRRRLLTRLSARRAALVLTDTEFSRSEIESRLGLPAAREGLERRQAEPLVLREKRKHRGPPERVGQFGVRHVGAEAYPAAGARVPAQRLEVLAR